MSLINAGGGQILPCHRAGSPEHGGVGVHFFMVLGMIARVFLPLGQGDNVHASAAGFNPKAVLFYRTQQPYGKNYGRKAEYVAQKICPHTRIP